MLIWCGVTLMNNLQVLQNKFAEINLNRLLYRSLFVSYWSPSNFKVAQPPINGWFYHSCIYVYKRINGFVDHTMELPANRDVHNYPGGLPYKTDGDARPLALGCKLQILVSLKVFGMESHYIFAPFKYRLVLCIKKFKKDALKVTKQKSPFGICLSLSHTHIGLP